MACCFELPLVTGDFELLQYLISVPDIQVSLQHKHKMAVMSKTGE